MSFLSWNDGDAALVRTLWCLVRHLKSKQVIETGVAHGVSSRFILAALERNGKVIFSVLTYLHWTDLGESKSPSRLATATRIDGPTLRVRAGDVFLHCFLNLDRLIFSFMAAFTANVTYCSKWDALGNPYDRAAL
jgi:hypothetical protein